MRDGFYGNAFAGEELHGLVESFVIGGFQFEDDLTDFRSHFRAPDVEHYIDGFAHLMDDGLFNQVRRINQFELPFGH
jgi:hypothetical protein